MIAQSANNDNGASRFDAPANPGSSHRNGIVAGGRGLSRGQQSVNRRRDGRAVTSDS